MRLFTRHLATDQHLLPLPTCLESCRDRCYSFAASTPPPGLPSRVHGAAVLGPVARRKKVFFFFRLIEGSALPQAGLYATS